MEASPDSSNGQKDSPDAAAKPTSRPMRAMLARGAACDLCRSRKVKCDGLHPVCTQCTKSARGNPDVINCVYDGGKVKKASAGGGGSSAKKAGTVNGATKKRERDVSLTAEDDDDDIDVQEDAAPTNAPRDPPPNDEDTRIKKKAATSGAGAQRVEQLVDRITELERRLRAQSAVPTALHTHPRSPPVSYSLSSSSGYPFPTSAAGLDMRRSLSNSQPLGTVDGVAAGDFAQKWTPESNVRFSSNGGGDNGRTVASPGGMGWSPLGSSAYASFIPTSISSDSRSTSETSQPGHPVQGMEYGSSNTRTFPGGSSYPPLNYTPPLHTQQSPSNDFSNLFDKGADPATYPILPTSGTNTFDLLDASSFIPPRTNGSSNPSVNSLQATSAPTSLAPSPEEPFDLDATLLQILFPAWPQSLPLPATVHHLVTVFFTRATVPATMLNRGRFIASLDLHPTNKQFPSTALLHAMCAYASAWVSSESLGGDVGGRKYWDACGTPKEYHYSEARKAIEAGLLGAHNQLQVLQAIILCSYMAYFSASFTELWLLSGQATRLCTPLGLNHLTPWNFASNELGDKQPDWQASFHSFPHTKASSVLPEAKDLEEHWERAATFWMAFSIDRHASAATAWSTSIDELDISTHLPCNSTTHVPCSSSLSIADPNFLHELNPAIGSFGLYIKAIVLLGRVVNYLQRMPKSMPPGETCTTIREKWKAAPEFQQLDLALGKFRTMTSNDFFNAGSFVDGHLASAYAIPHAASILLHEPYCDKDDRSPTSSLARCLTSAKCVVNSTYILYQSNNDLSGLDPFIGYCWSVVGRALVRDNAVRTYWNDIESANFSRQLAEHVLSFTSRCTKSGATVPILSHMHNTLSGLLKNPAALLPPDDFECLPTVPNLAPSDFF